MLSLSLCSCFPGSYFMNRCNKIIFHFLGALYHRATGGYHGAIDSKNAVHHLTVFGFGASPDPGDKFITWHYILVLSPMHL